MARANLDHRGAAFGIRSVTADDGRDAEERQVVPLENIPGLADPFVGIALEVIDHLNMGDGVENVLGENLARSSPDVAMGQLRRERYHVGNYVADRILVEGLFRVGGEEHRVLGLEEEPLEIGEKGLRMLIDRGLGTRQRVGIVTGEAGG
jgi:hypothetical protein